MSDPLTRRHNQLTPDELASVERVMELDGVALKQVAVAVSGEWAYSDKQSIAQFKRYKDERK